MKWKLFIFSMAIIMYMSCSPKMAPTPSSIYLDLSMFPSLPQVFGSGKISTGFGERDFAFSPDGNEIFYTMQSPQGIFQTILYSRKIGAGKWSAPQIAPFAGNYSDLEPAFSPDGKKLYFSSNRPISGNEVKDFDIWMVERSGDGWGSAQNLGLPINTTSDEFYPSVTKSGNIYYTAAYANAIGKEDIFVSKWINGKYESPVQMDTAINTKTYEFNAFVSPDEDFILFTSYGRADDMGRGDLYMSIKNDKGVWLPATHLSTLNSNKIDYCPFVSFDKKILFFTSERVSIPSNYKPKAVILGELKAAYSSPQNGSGDIYWVDFEKIYSDIKMSKK